jgi:hypothetical protein
MSGEVITTAVRSLIGAVLERNRPAVEAALASRGLSADEVHAQDLAGLRKSLAAIDDLVADPKQLGAFQAFPEDAEGGRRSKREGKIVFSPKPILLERRTLILQRMALLEQQQQLDAVIRAAGIVDVQGRHQPDMEAVERLKAANEARQVELQREIVKTQLARGQAVDDMIVYETHQMAMRQRLATIRQSYFSREVVAGVAGLALMLVFGATLVVAMFTHTAVSSIISDSFLLVLGYFFGQAASKPSKDSGEDT